jgi:glycosyltransferase involved in cell wall biosynthesis
VYVLAITDYLGNVGGAEISAKTILEGVAAHPVTEDVVVVGLDTPAASRFEFDGVNVIPVDPPPGIDKVPDFVGDLIVERRLAKAAHRRAPDADIIHAHHRRGMYALSHIDSDCPTVGTVRDFWPICPISVYHVDGEQCTGCDDCLGDCLAYQGWDGMSEPVRKYYLLAKRAHNRRSFVPDHAVFITDHLRRQVAESIKIPPSSVISNPVSIDREPVQERPEQPTFVVASTLSKEKGVPTAINAMAQVHEHYPEAKLLVFGDGPLEDALRDQAKDLSDGTVEICGRVSPEELYEKMATATATVFPSEWDEPFGRVTVESMALGTPVVGSRVGGIAEIIDNENTGKLFCPGDVGELASLLVELIDNPDAWHQLSKAGIDRSKQFSPEPIVEEHVELYQSMASGSR